METETSPQTLVFVCFAFLLFGGWDRESVCVKVLILLFGYLFLSYLTSRAVLCQQSQDECIRHTKLLFQSTYSFLEMSGCGLSAKPK